MPDSCPIWDLNDLYSGFNDVKLASDVASCRKTALSLHDAWQGRLATTPAEELASVISQYEALLEQLGRVQSHAQLMFAANTAEPEIARHHQSMREVGAEIHAKIPAEIPAKIPAGNSTKNLVPNSRSGFSQNSWQRVPKMPAKVLPQSACQRFARTACQSFAQISPQWFAQYRC